MHSLSHTVIFLAPFIAWQDSTCRIALVTDQRMLNAFIACRRMHTIRGRAQMRARDQRDQALAKPCGMRTPSNASPCTQLWLLRKVHFQWAGHRTPEIRLTLPWRSIKQSLTAI